MGLLSCGAVLLLLAAGVQAGDVQPYQEYANRVRGAEQVSPLTDTLFGDSVSLYNGQTTFSQVDISLPGNDVLPVELVRKLSVQAIPYMMQPDKLYGAGSWDVDVPYITGMLDGFYKWDVGLYGSEPRCSSPFFPGTSSNVRINDIFSGFTINIPGKGVKSLMGRSNANAPQPNDGQVHRWMTQDLDAFSCTSSTKNGYPGEGFIMHTPDGLKYTFDVALEKFPGTVNSMGVSRPRVRVYMLASKIEDRHGNAVNYTYDGSGHPTLISSSDGRSISMTYSNGQLVSATANGRVWTYQYADGWLQSVTQPDGGVWTFAQAGNLKLGKVVMDWRMDQYCSMQPPIEPYQYGLTMTHPSGATGQFDFEYMRHYRSGVSVRSCVVDMPGAGGDPPLYSLAVPNFFDVYSLTRKAIAGAGVAAPMSWTYAYDRRAWDLIGGAPGTCTDLSYCPLSKTTAVTDSTGAKQESTFGIRFYLNDGKPLGSRTIASDGRVLRSETIEYLSDAEMSGQPFPDFFGGIWGGDDNRATFLRPMKRKIIAQDGAETTFETRVDRFDSLARPVQVTKLSSLGFSRSETTAYHDNLTRWLIGQVAAVTCTAPASCAGKVMSQTDYDPSTALPVATYSFGKFTQGLTYNPDGTVSSVVDGRGNATSLSGWYRGVPRVVTYPATSDQPSPVGESAVVDDNGWIRSITDANGFTTGFDYDSMGRQILVDYPDGDTVDWASTTRSFAPSGVSAYGLPIGHWRHVTTTGQAIKVTYLDALWRPVVEETYDGNNPSGTRSVVAMRYDAKGQLVFKSYPLRTLTNYTDPSLKGVWTEYDDLGRVTASRQDTEIGLLSTTTQYLPGLQVRVTKPAGQQTLSGYQAFDEPAIDLPVWIQAPEDANTTITRDAFGKPMSVRRHNSLSTISLTRSYVYDANEQLCKVIEPETGSTVTHYDAAGNVDWSASGLDLPSTSSCDFESVPATEVIRRAFDARNRIKALVFPDGRGTTATIYAPDGAVASLTVDNGGADGLVTTDYYYNKRRLLIRERLRVGAYDWSMSTSFDANGNPSGLTYPDGLSIALAPNALGQPRQMGSYATNVSYYANGAMAGFTYGNGIVHSMTQNARQLPERSVDALGGTSILDDSYDYDGNGNVAAISDGLPGFRGDRSMVYDGLDRLTSVTSPVFGVAGDQTARYTYDVLDNLTSIAVGGTLPRIHWYCYDTRWQLSNIKNATCGGGQTITGLGYDARGNLTNKNGQLFVFDRGNRLRSAQTAQETYQYDGQGRRVRAAHATAGTIYSMYDQSGVLRFQRNERDGKAKNFISLNGSLVAAVTNIVSVGVPLLTAPSYVTSGGFAISWTSVPAASRYELQERAGSSGWTVTYSGGGNTASISGKSSGLYSYQVRACTSTFCGGWSAEKVVSVTLPPSSVPVISLQDKAIGGSYTVTWSAATGATSHTLEESANGGASWVTAYSGPALEASYTSKPGGTYSYRVKGCNAAGCSPLSGVRSVISVQPPAEAPALTGPAAAPFVGSNYTVTWNTVSAATSYVLEERMGSGGWATFGPNAGTSVSLSGRTTGSYGYRIRACNDAGCGPYSAERSVAVLLAPVAPALVLPMSNATGSYTLSWNLPADATNFQIEESAGGGPWHAIYSGSSTALAINGRGTANYRYRGLACNAAGCSGYSTEAAISVLLPPGTPAITYSVRLKSTRPVWVKCSVDWTKVPNASIYELANSGGTIDYSGPLNGVSGTGTQYCSTSHTVRACNNSGCSPWSSPPYPQKLETTDDT